MLYKDLFLCCFLWWHPAFNLRHHSTIWNVLLARTRLVFSRRNNKFIDLGRLYSWWHVSHIMEPSMPLGIHLASIIVKAILFSVYNPSVSPFSYSDYERRTMVQWRRVIEKITYRKNSVGFESIYFHWYRFQQVRHL